jgi:hypothetical protein
MPTLSETPAKKKKTEVVAGNQGAVSQRVGGGALTLIGDVILAGIALAQIVNNNVLCK